MRCDLHVHTMHSGPCTVPVARRFCRESYNDPLAVYHTLKALGMDLVTITDHDSIAAAETLGRFPDFFASEEVTITLPSGTEAHIAVYDLTETQHFQIQQRRNDLPRLLNYLREQNLIYGVNHLFSSLTGRRDTTDFVWFADHFPLWETKNSAMLGEANRAALRMANTLAKGQTGGSDSHTMRTLASAYTEVKAARDRDEFLAGLRAGRGQVHGADGSWWRVNADVVTIAYELFREQPVAWSLAPLLVALPAVTLGNYISEWYYAKRGPAICAGALGRCPMTPAPVAEAELA